MTAYYNEIDPYAAQWLRNLIAAGLIAPGDVDERDIRDVSADDVRGYDECHFFAGIGGFSLACLWSGWTGQVWTGGPPCQDNSNAAAIHGKRTGLRGKRSGLAHTWLDLVEECRPETIIFENVPGIAPWLAEVTGRLESVGYRISKPERSSAGAGALHRRKRMFVIADLGGTRLPVTGPGRSPAIAGQPRRTAPRDFWRETEPGIWRMDHGLPTRLAQLRAFGNAVDPYVVAGLLLEMMAGKSAAGEAG